MEIRIDIIGGICGFVTAHWKVLCLLAGVALAALARKGREEAKKAWSLLLAAGLCLGLFGRAELAAPVLKRAAINHGSRLEMTGDDGFRLNGVDYKNLELSGYGWPGPEGETVYWSEGRRIKLDRVPNGPKLDILCRGGYLFCREDQAEEALAWYNDWDNYDIYLGNILYPPPGAPEPVWLLDPQPDVEKVIELLEFYDAVEAEKEYHEDGVIRRPREGSLVAIEVEQKTGWEELQLYFRSHDDLVTKRTPRLYKFGGRLCGYVYKNMDTALAVVPLPEDLSDYFLAYWPEE